MALDGDLTKVYTFYTAIHNASTESRPSDGGDRGEQEFPGLEALYKTLLESTIRVNIQY